MLRAVVDDLGQAGDDFALRVVRQHVDHLQQLGRQDFGLRDAAEPAQLREDQPRHADLGQARVALGAGH